MDQSAHKTVKMAISLIIEKNHLNFGPNFCENISPLARCKNSFPAFDFWPVFVVVRTLKVEPPGGNTESVGDQSKHPTEKYKH